MVNFILENLVQNNIIERNDLEEYQYALTIVFLKFIHYFMIFIVSIFFNILFETVVFLYVYVPIRTYIGGYHSKNMYICLLISFLFIVFLYFFLKYLVFINKNIVFLLILIGLYYFFHQCDNHFLNKVKLTFLFVFIVSIVLLITSQNNYLISIAYSIMLNFILFKLS